MWELPWPGSSGAALADVDGKLDAGEDGPSWDTGADCESPENGLFSPVPSELAFVLKLRPEVRSLAKPFSEVRVPTFGPPPADSSVSLVLLAVLPDFCWTASNGESSCAPSEDCGA